MLNLQFLYRLNCNTSSYCLPLVFLIALWSCNTTSTPHTLEVPKAPTPITAPAQEAFDAFNKRFHQDSLFQLSRIAFPIGGKNRNGTISQCWNQKNWALLKVPVMKTPDPNQYQHCLHQTDSLVVETYWIEDSGFKVERQFNKIKGKWFLTYYDNMNI